MMREGVGLIDRSYNRYSCKHTHLNKSVYRYSIMQMYYGLWGHIVIIELYVITLCGGHIL